MCAVVTQSVSLEDARRTQRRLSALLLSDTQTDKQRYPLRRQIVPQGYCYVCSKIDPGGIFRRPNSYMFRKGFFSACEHFPKAPFSTFVAENDEEDDVIIDHAFVETETEDGKRTAAPSISVQIRRNSSFGKYTPSERLGRGSSMDKMGRDSSRTNFKSLSSPDKTGRESSRASIGRGQETRDSKQSRDSKRTSRLPAISQRNHEGSRSYNASSTQSQNRPPFIRGSTDTSIEMERLRALSSKLSPEKTRQYSEDDRLILPDAHESRQAGVGQAGSIHLPDVHIAESIDKTERYETVSTKSENSRISNQSPFSVSVEPLNHVPSATDKEIIDAEAKGITEIGITNKPLADSRLANYHSRPIINADDGLDHTVLPVYPVLKDLFGMTTLAGVANQERPKAGRKRESLDKKEKKFLDETNKETDGRFQYHHRGMGDSVPYPGFEIPPTPTAEELAEIERIEMEQIELELAEEEKRHLEKMVAEGRVFDTDRFSKALTEEDSVLISNTPSLTIKSWSGKRSFCRCPTDIRVVGSTQICKHCGKVVGKNSYHSDHKSKSRTEFESEFPFSRSMGSTGIPSRTSREKMLNDRKLTLPVRTRTVSDEDYMDLESIIQDDDARYWSSDEEDVESTTVATTSSSLRRLRNAKPYPLVNPDIHKEVYIRALNDAQFNQMKKTREKRFDEFKRLRRPLVFSYYQLWPFAGKADGCGNDLGIRPDKSFDNKKPKPKQLMKHIFGDVKLEDYYPGGGKSYEPRIVLDSLRSDDRSMTKSIDASVINSGNKIKRSGILFAE